MASEHPHPAAIGVSDHGGWAILVAVTGGGTILDRRRVELVDPDLPCMPHHVEGQRLPPAEAVALVARVRASAERHAAIALGAFAASLAVPVTAIALRALQKLPPTVEERLTDYRARNTADWVMYREALAGAAAARGMAVSWFDPRKVFDAAAATHGIADMDAHLTQLGREVGRPWTKDHRLAVAGAMATLAPMR